MPKIRGGFGAFGRIEAKLRSPSAILIQTQAIRGQANRKWRLGQPAKLSDSRGMVKMSMGQPDLGYFPTILVCRLDNKAAVKRRVNHYSQTAAGLNQYIRIVG